MAKGQRGRRSGRSTIRMSLYLWVIAIGLARPVLVHFSCLFLILHFASFYLVISWFLFNHLSPSRDASRDASRDSPEPMIPSPHPGPNLHSRRQHRWLRGGVDSQVGQSRLPSLETQDMIQQMNMNESAINQFSFVIIIITRCFFPSLSLSLSHIIIIIIILSL